MVMEADELLDMCVVLLLVVMVDEEEDAVISVIVGDAVVVRGSTLFSGGRALVAVAVVG